MSDWKRLRQTLTAALLVVVLVACSVGMAAAKSLYVISDIASSPTPIQAYDIHKPAPPYLVHQATSPVPHHGGGAVGLAIDTDSAVLFVTYEMSNVIEIVDAQTMASLGSTTAPGAFNLAGIVVDQEKKLVYAVDRLTNSLYIYNWNPATKTLILNGLKALSNVTAAYGIALDEINDLLFVADRDSAFVRYFRTSDWVEAGKFTITQKPVGIAVDAKRRFVYTGNPSPAYNGLRLLSKYDLNTNTEQTINIAALSQVSTDNVVGLAVDPDTGLLYIDTGDEWGAGSNQLMVFDSNLALLASQPLAPFQQQTPHPTGLCVPGKQISYNPLHLTLTDGLAEGVCAAAGSQITFTICYDNLANAAPVTGVALVVTLPAGIDLISAPGGVYNAVSRTVTWAIGTLPASAPQQCKSMVALLNPTATPGSSIITSAKISSDQIPPTTVDEVTQVCAQKPGLYQAFKSSSGNQCQYQKGYKGQVDDAISAAPGVLKIVPGDKWGNFVAAKQAGIPYTLKNVTLKKEQPQAIECPEFYPGKTITQTGTPKIRLTWPLMFELPGTTWTLTITYRTPILWDDDGSGPNCPSYVHTNVWTWTVESTLESIKNVLELFHQLPWGLMEIPIISSDKLYQDLQNQVDKVILYVSDPSKGNALDAMFDLEAMITEAAIVDDYAAPDPTLGTGIANTLCYPAACKLLADCEAAGIAAGIFAPIKR